MTETYVIVGGGLAGASAAAELREQGFEGRVVLLGEEPHLPYERPPLTKQLLRGESELDEALAFDTAFYAEHEVDARVDARVESLDLAARAVLLADGSREGYDRLMLATGARPIALPVAGADLDGVMTLRTVDDAVALRSVLAPGARVAVIGGGWIGCEVAASATQMGASVTLVEAAEAPLVRVLGPAMGGFFGELHRDHGVELLTGVGLASFEGAGGHVTAAVLADGRRVECDVAIVGVGVRPAVELAARAGLAVSNGIEVDEALRTSDAAVFAAGDVALARHPRYGALRVEHWENARAQGRAAARSMLGQAVVYDPIPYFFSDQYDLGMEYSGLSEADDQLVIRGSLDARELIAFWLRDGRVTAGMNVNVWDVADQIQALIRSDRVVDPVRLGDPAVPLEELAAAPA